MQGVLNWVSQPAPGQEPPKFEARCELCTCGSCSKLIPGEERPLVLIQRVGGREGLLEQSVLGELVATRATVDGGVCARL